MPPDDVRGLFVERLKTVLGDLGIPEVQWGGFLFGFAYRELRRNFSEANTRAMIDVATATAEDIVRGQGSE